MNWISAFINFNDETDFMICYKLYIKIYIYKFLEKIVN